MFSGPETTALEPASSTSSDDGLDVPTEMDGIQFVEEEEELDLIPDWVE